jgi:hypothetical protein
VNAIETTVPEKSRAYKAPRVAVPCRFASGDLIYFLNNNEVRQAIVRHIRIDINAAGTETQLDAHMEGLSYSVNGNRAFLTKEELLASL